MGEELRKQVMLAVTVEVAAHYDAEFIADAIDLAIQNQTIADRTYWRKKVAVLGETVDYGEEDRIALWT